MAESKYSALLVTFFVYSHDVYDDFFSLEIAANCVDNSLSLCFCSETLFSLNYFSDRSSIFMLSTTLRCMS